MSDWRNQYALPAGRVRLLLGVALGLLSAQTLASTKTRSNSKLNRYLVRHITGLDVRALDRESLLALSAEPGDAVCALNVMHINRLRSMFALNANATFKQSPDLQKRQGCLGYGLAWLAREAGDLQRLHQLVTSEDGQVTQPKSRRGSGKAIAITVWRSLEDAKAYAWGSPHLEVMRNTQAWAGDTGGAIMAYLGGEELQTPLAKRLIADLADKRVNWALAQQLAEATPIHVYDGQQVYTRDSTAGELTLQADYFQKLEQKVAQLLAAQSN